MDVQKLMIQLTNLTIYKIFIPGKSVQIYKKITDPAGEVGGLADLAIKVKDKAEQAESNQQTCGTLVSILFTKI